MCGRTRCTVRPDDILRACHLNGQPVRYVEMDRYRTSYNVSPGRNLPVVRREGGSDSEGAVLQCMKWGLIPSFTKKNERPDHYRMFNARCESICEKASFRRLVPNNRCLVTVEGFYEWKKDGSKKQPYYIYFKDGRPLVFAALYDSWKNSEGEILYTFTILTTCSSSALEWLHDRMPVIFGDKGAVDIWLNGSSSSKFDAILKPYEEPDLAWYPVTPAMGKPSFDEPECVKEIQPKTQETKPISRFFSKKEPKNEQESSPIETNQPRSLKVKPESSDSIYHGSITKKGGGDSKSNENVSTTTTNEGGADFPTKRDYEEFTIDTKPSVDETDNVRTSPVKKKGKGASDKQPTLFSYFGKG